MTARVTQQEPRSRRRAAAGAPTRAAGPAGCRRPHAGRAAPARATPRSVARLISLVEDASPALREVAAALAAAHRPRAGARADRLARCRQVDDDDGAGAGAARRPASGSGVLAVDPSSPFSGGALLGDRVRMQDHAGDSGVYIRSMASRGHLGGLAWATPQALRVLDAAGCDVVLIETVGVGQSELEIASLADTTLVLVAPGMGDGIQAAKAGHPRGRRRLRRQQGRPGRRRPDRARPALHAVPRRPALRGRATGGRRSARPSPRGTTDNGIDEVLAKVEAAPRSGWSPRARGTAGAASGPRARSRRSPWPRCASGWATCTGRRRWARSPSRWWRGRPTRTAPRTSCSPQL